MAKTKSPAKSATAKPAKPAHVRQCSSCLARAKGVIAPNPNGPQAGDVVTRAVRSPVTGRLQIVTETVGTDSLGKTWKPPIHPAACLRCNRCKACKCTCIPCRECKELTPTTKPSRWCSRCKCCRACDRCRKMPHYSSPDIFPGTHSTKHVNTLPRALGLELEIAEWGRLDRFQPTYGTYTIAHDWSVKPSEREMVLNPLAGDNFLRAMTELSLNLAKSRATVNETCALHVHVSGADLSYWELRRLLRVYARVESEIYDYLILPHRRDNPSVVHYCQMMTQIHRDCDRCIRFDQQYPRARRKLENLNNIIARMEGVTNTSELKEQFLKMLYNLPAPHRNAGNRDTRVSSANNLNTRKGGRYEWARYVGLNLHAWLYRGTVEWRMKEATTSIDELICWPLWCGWFVETTTRMSEKESKQWWNLLDFTERYMPRFVTEWVSNKITQRKSAVLS